MYGRNRRIHVQTPIDGRIITQRRCYSTLTTPKTVPTTDESDRQRCCTMRSSYIQNQTTTQLLWISSILLTIHLIHRTRYQISDVTLVNAFISPTVLIPFRVYNSLNDKKVEKLYSVTAENADMEFRQKRNTNQNNQNDSTSYINSWREVPGGYVPQLLTNNNVKKETNSIAKQQFIASTMSSQHTPSPLPPTTVPSSSSSTKSSSTGTSPMKKNTTPTTMRIRQLSTLQDYKHYVVDDLDENYCITITVVRFYAPWCRACQAIQQRYYRLAQQYEQLQLKQQQQSSSQQSVSSSSLVPIQVRFMECPVTKDNAVLHQGLGVPSLPYGHIYHSKVGLVEEMKLNKNVFTTFENTLASYVNGYCTVTYLDDDDDDIGKDSRLTETTLSSMTKDIPSTFD
jgi:thiol-disulfide isomerase/thioredoxin